MKTQQLLGILGGITLGSIMIDRVLISDLNAKEAQKRLDLRRTKPPKINMELDYNELQDVEFITAENEEEETVLFQQEKKLKFMVWNQRPWHFGAENGVFLSNNCTFSNCYYDGRGTKFAFWETNGVVIIGNPETYNQGQYLQYFASRNPKTLFFFVGRGVNSVGLTIRKQCCSSNMKMFKDSINFTMSHRRDSDIWLPYGFILPKDLDQNSFAKDGSILWMPVPPKSWVQDSIKNLSRTNDIIWITPNCKQSGIEWEFVRNFSSLQVDVYGKCGSNTISSDPGIEAQIVKTYKFLLYIENYGSHGHVTEKFFRALEFSVIPIVRGPSMREMSEIAPPKSYIHVDEFSSLEHLENHLRFLSNNKEEYLKYFWWKRYYNVIRTDQLHRKKGPKLAEMIPETLNPFCNFCKALNGELKPKRMYPQMKFHDWWVKDINCGNFKRGCEQTA